MVLNALKNFAKENTRIQFHGIKATNGSSCSNTVSLLPCRKKCNLKIRNREHEYIA